MSFPDDKDFEDMASSADLEDAQEPDTVEDIEAVDDADTSTATSETEDDSLLAVVRDVVEGKQTDDEASQAESEETVEEDADQSGDEDDDNYENVPFNKHPDFRRLVRKKNEFRDQAKAFEQDAIRYQNVQSFLDQHGVEAEEAAELLVIGGLMKTNPAEAWKRAKPAIQQLLIAAGEVLPNDLVSRVQAGEMSHEAALEVSRTRALQQSMSATQSFEAQRRQQQQHVEAVNSLRQTANDWETERRAKDPNFETKMPLIMREVAYLQRVEGVPNTPEGVKAQLQKAYKAAATVAPSPAPAAKKRAITPVRGGQVAGGTKPAVNSTMDVVNSVLAASRGA